MAGLLIRRLWTSGRRGESRHCWMITFVPAGTRAPIVHAARDEVSCGLRKSHDHA
jgi:hypothetical protein